MLENMNKSINVKAIMSHHQLVHQALSDLGTFRKGLQMLLNTTELPYPESNVVVDILSNGDTVSKYGNCFSLSLDEVILDFDSLIGDIAKVYNLDASQYVEKTTQPDKLEYILQSFTVLTNSVQSILAICEIDRRIEDLVIHAHELQETYDGFTNPFAYGVDVFLESFTQFQLSFLNEFQNKIGVERFNGMSHSLLN